MLANWNTLIARKDEIQDYVPAHWNGDLSEEGFVDSLQLPRDHAYRRRRGGREGRPLDDLFAEFNLATRFPALNGTPGFTGPGAQRHHRGAMVRRDRSRIGRHRPAALIEEKGPTPPSPRSRRTGRRIRTSTSSSRPSINQLGYRFLNEEKYDEAIAVFKMNVDWYPDSWNVYDSLGEAYMKSGQHDLAVNHYSRSLELNPENENGQKMLEEMSTVLAQK